MGGNFPRVWVLCALVAVLAGCATQQSGQTGAVDPIRLLNAIVADDVGYVRDAVGSGAIGVNQSIPAPAYMEGTPLITIAARAASLNVLRYLLSAGANVNAPTPVGETPLMLAAYFQDTSLTGTATERHDGAVRLLVAAGAGLENEHYQYTPLAYAAYQGREGTVRYLLERGARIDADAADGESYVNTPLMMASMMGHYKLAVALLRAGADPRVRIKGGGMTARELALKYQHSSLAQLLACAETTGPGSAFTARCQ